MGKSNEDDTRVVPRCGWVDGWVITGRLGSRYTPFLEA